MTLPSSRRPPELDHILNLEAEDENSSENGGCDGVKVKTDLKQYFMDQMLSWYNNLSPKLKEVLTKKRVIRQAIALAYRLRLPYDHLPEKWMETLCNEHGMHFTWSGIHKRRRIEMEKLLEAQKEKQLVEGGVNDPSKIVDLTQEPPPREWLAAYAEGIQTPRVLKLHPDTEGALVMYYDYEPNIEFMDGSSPRAQQLRQPPHDRDGVLPYLSHPTSWSS